MSSLSAKRNVNLEKHISYIDELAHALSEEAGEEEIFFRDRSFKERYFEVTKMPNVIGEAFNISMIKGYFEALLLQDKGNLCTRLCDILGIKGMLSVSTFFDESEEGDGSVCYVRSPYADNAYLSFAQMLDDPKAIYCEDFTQACEDVYYGRSTYCILPLSNSKDGRLGGFRNLAIKYSLIKVCTVKIPSDDTETLFALMKKDLEIPRTQENAYFEFRILRIERLNELLCVAGACGMTAASVDMTEDHCDIVLAVNEDGICGFLTYLSLEYEGFIPLGIYKEI